MSNNNGGRRRVSGSGNPADINNPLDMSNRSTNTNGSVRNYGGPLSPYHSPNPQFTSFPSPSSPAQAQQQLYQMHQLRRQVQMQQYQQQQLELQNMQRQQQHQQRPPMSPSSYMQQQQQHRRNSFPPPPQPKSPSSKKPTQQLQSPQNSLGTPSPFSNKPKLAMSVSGPLPPPPLSRAPSTTAPPPHKPAAPAASKPAAAKESHKRHSTISYPPMEVTQAAAMVKQCDWIDKALWSSRQILGGQQVNGFLRSTATVQRFKKQRARQHAKTRHDKQQGEDAKVGLSAEKEQEAEEVLKKDILNTRTAKKMKVELEQGIQYCTALHETIRDMIQQMDPSFPKVEALNQRRGPVFAVPTATVASASRPSGLSNMNANPAATSVQANVMGQHKSSATSSAASAGDANGSSLRRYRKKKLPPSGQPRIQLPEYDERTGKRTCTKKEYLFRIFELLRFRALRKNDAVAARTTSRDLWILARVVNPYPESNMAPAEFVRLSATRRDQLFKDKVLIQDVEDHEEPIWVARSLVLPLARNVSEAAESTSRFLKKGSRVYAMYPQTTSLYTATVVDSTTYCRDMDDIVVVEFDGDEPNDSGMIPHCHIPARFVTLIPREFPGAAAPGGGGKNNNKKRGSIATPTAPPAPDPLNSVLDNLDLDADLPGLEDGFEDLDFDLL